VPYARALDNWASTATDTRRLNGNHIELSLKTAEGGRAALQAYALGRLCSLTFIERGSDPAEIAWLKLAALPSGGAIPEVTLARSRYAGTWPSPTVDGVTLRVKGVIAGTAAIQVNENKRIHALVLIRPGGTRSLAILPFFSPKPLGILPGTIVELVGTVHTDVMSEYSNRNTAKAIAALYGQVNQDKRGIIIQRFQLSEHAERDRSAAIAQRLRPIYDVAPSSVAGIWSLQPGLASVITSKSWFVDETPDARHRALAPSF